MTYPAPPLPPQPDDSHFTPAGTGAVHHPFPGVTLHTAACHHMMLSVVHLESGATVELHAHPHEQVGYLVSGTLDFTINGVTRRLSPGDQWRIPGHTPHACTAINGPALALDIFHPPRDDYR